jgi:hypothetical protein
MPKGMQPIYTYTLPSASGGFSMVNIPQTYTDLQVVISGRANNAGSWDPLTIGFNGVTPQVFSQTGFWAENITVYQYRSNNLGYFSYNTAFSNPGSGMTAGYHSNISMYIPNYTSNTWKSIMIDSAGEGPVAGSPIGMGGGLWRAASAIHNFTMIPYNGPTLAAGTTITLYGIKN